MNGTERNRYFEQFIWPQLEAAYRFARWMVRDHHDAEDVVQESFVKAYRAAESFRGSDVRPWLFAIVRNSAVNYLQRQRTKEGPDAAELADPSPDPETSLARKRDRDRVRAAIRELPAEFREALLLREMEDMAYKEIAAVLNTPIGTVMSRLSRARQSADRETQAARGGARMTCDEARPLLDAYFDSELDLTASLAVERHTAECVACAQTLSDLQELRAKLSAEAWNAFDDADLRPLRASIRRATGTQRRVVAGWVVAALAAALTVAAIVPWTLHRGPNLERELVDSHVRSLMAEHLVDVPSSNRHTVKPWFQGKIDFAPDVPDLSAQGFELAGGRLDVLDGKQAAALVYRHGGHVLNLWTVRTSGADLSPAYSVLDGYRVAHWKTNGLERWAVSDMSEEDARAFVDAFQRR